MDKQVTKKNAKTKRNGLIAAAGVALALLVLVIVGLTMFFQSPEKKIADGFANLIQAKSVGVDATTSSTSNFGEVTTTIKGSTDKKAGQADVSFQYEAKNNKFKGDVQVLVDQDGILYAKLDKPAEFMKSYADVLIKDIAGTTGALSAQQQEQFFAPVRQSLVAVGEKIDNKWVKLTDTDVRTLLGGGEANTDCYTAFGQKLQEDASARNELASAYQKYKFVKIDTTIDDKEYGQGYRITLDQAKLKDFKDAVAKNAAVKELGSCGLDILTLGANGDGADQSIDLWLDKFSHDITRVRYTTAGNENPSTIDMKLSYDVPVDVTTPNDAVSLKSVMPSIFSTNQ